MSELFNALRLFNRALSRLLEPVECQSRMNRDSSVAKGKLRHTQKWPLPGIAVGKGRHN
jgi:hypothetical protein